MTLGLNQEGTRQKCTYQKRFTNRSWKVGVYYATPIHLFEFLFTFVLKIGLELYTFDQLFITKLSYHIWLLFLILCKRVSLTGMIGFCFPWVCWKIYVFLRISGGSRCDYFTKACLVMEGNRGDVLHKVTRTLW